MHLTTEFVAITTICLLSAASLIQMREIKKERSRRLNAETRLRLFIKVAGKVRIDFSSAPADDLRDLIFETEAVFEPEKYSDLFAAQSMLDYRARRWRR